MRLPRTLCLLFLLAGLGWFQFIQPLPARDLAQRATDIFDRRPARRILILGSSRTYFHGMPYMIRAMADSANDPQKYQITAQTLPGASFESLWNDSGTQTLLRKDWDDAILQSKSCAQTYPQMEHSFQTYGERLAQNIHLSSGAPRLVVNWSYGPESFDGGDPDGRGSAAYGEKIESSTRLLGNRVGAKLVDAGRLWVKVAQEHPDIQPTEDGNHPTLAGSYLPALALYADLSHRDVGPVTYVPMNLDPSTAMMLRKTVQDFEAFGL